MTTSHEQLQKLSAELRYWIGHKAKGKTSIPCALAVKLSPKKKIPPKIEVQKNFALPKEEVKIEIKKEPLSKASSQKPIVKEEKPQISYALKNCFSDLASVYQRLFPNQNLIEEPTQDSKAYDRLTAWLESPPVRFYLFVLPEYTQNAFYLSVAQALTIYGAPTEIYSISQYNEFCKREFPETLKAIYMPETVFSKEELENSPPKKQGPIPVHCLYKPSHYIDTPLHKAILWKSLKAHLLQA